MGAVKTMAEAAGRLCGCGRLKEPLRQMCDRCLQQEGRTVVFCYKTTARELRQEVEDARL